VLTIFFNRTKFNGMSLQYIFSFHRQKIAVEHRRRLHERFGESKNRNFDGESPRLPDSSLDVIDSLAKVRMTASEIVAGIQNRNDWLAFKLLRGVAGLLLTGTMPKATKVVWTKEPETSQLVGLTSTI